MAAKAKRKKKHDWLNKPMKRREKFKKMYDNAHRVGHPPAFESPGDLLELAMEYFEWVDKNPWQEAKICSFQGVNDLENVPKKIPYTFIGVCLYMGCTQQTLNTYKGFPEYTEVFDFISQTIKDQKYEGAAAGFFNHAIIARDLGLTDGETKIIINNNINPEQEMKDRGIPLPDLGDVGDLDDAEGEG